MGVYAFVLILEPGRSPTYQSIRQTNAGPAMTTISFDDGANSVAAGLRMTYEVVSSVWGVASTWTVKARSLLEAVRKASEELSVRSYAGYIVSVRQVDAS